MPELPEVESIRIKLEKYLVDHKIEKVTVNDRRILKRGEKKLKGGRVKKIRRFGKVLIIDLDNGYSAVTHVKLTGQFIYRGPKLKKPPELSKKVYGGVSGKHTHVVFELDRGGKLYYNDYRRFGWIKIVETKKVKNMDFISKLGPEPLNGLTLEKFKKIISSTKRSIKTLLMDQTRIAGIGNIYANDALYLAKIHPKKSADKLSKKEVKNLYEAINKVLKKGLKMGGSSEVAFVTPDGAEGEYQKHTLLYSKEGEKCLKCGGKIKKIKVGGRGTYLCPNCQKK